MARNSPVTVKPPLEVLACNSCKRQRQTTALILKDVSCIMYHRILMVSDFFYPNCGGVESHIFQLSQCLMKRGHKVVVYTHAYGDRIGVRHLTEGLKVYYSPRIPFYQQATFPTFYGGFRLLRAVLIREGITMVHCHQSYSMLSDHCVIYARTMGYKVVFTDHSLFGFADLSSIVINKYMKFSLCDVHAIICVSHTTKESLVLRACIPPSRVSVIPNAVDARQFEPDVTPRPDDMITVVALTRLVYRKGLDLIAAILPEFCRRRPNVRVIICGDGPKLRLLQEVISCENLEGQVELMPGVPHSKVRSVLIKGDIFLNASLTEAFCIAIVEAAASGLRVVSTRVGGIPEVLPPEMMVLAEPEPQSLLEALEAAVESVGTIDPWKQHRAVKEMYCWERVAERTELVYDQVVCSERDDSLYARLVRAYKCGSFAGKLFCLMLSLHDLFWKFLQFWEPASGIDKAPDYVFPTT